MPKLDIVVGFSTTETFNYITNNLLPNIQEAFKVMMETQNTDTTCFALSIQQARQALKDNVHVIFHMTSDSKRNRNRILTETADIQNLDTQCHVVLTLPEAYFNHQNYNLSMDNVFCKELISFSVPDEEQEYLTMQTIYYKPCMASDYLKQVVGQLYSVQQTGPWHTENVAKHTAMALQYALKHNYPPYLIEAIKYHDIGKLYSCSVDELGHHHFYGHANAGAYLYLFGKIRTNTFACAGVQAVRTYIAKLIEHHDDPCHKDFNEYTFRQKYGDPFANDIMMMRKADVAGSIREKLKQEDN